LPPPPYFLLSPTPTLLPLFPFPSFIAIRFLPSRSPTLPHVPLPSSPFVFFFPHTPSPTNKQQEDYNFYFILKFVWLFVFFSPNFRIFAT
jgi:hypothetical protein